MVNISSNGELDNDLFLRALLQLRNTPEADCGLSPAEIVFGHPLRDAFSFINRLVKFSNHHIPRKWRETWKAKENALRIRAGRNDAALAEYTRPLGSLKCQFLSRTRGAIFPKSRIRLALLLRSSTLTNT